MFLFDIFAFIFCSGCQILILNSSYFFLFLPLFFLYKLCPLICLSTSGATMKSPPQIFFNDFVKLIFPIFPIRPPLPIHPHLYHSLVRACKLPRIQVGNREVRDLMGMEPKLEHSSSSIFLFFFLRSFIFSPFPFLSF